MNSPDATSPPVRHLRLVAEPAIDVLDLSSAGRIAEALAQGEREERGMNDDQLLSWINVLICAGQYRRALAVGETFNVPDYERVSPWTLNQTNLAEAEYNLGAWQAALDRLDRLTVPLKHSDPIAGTASGLQRAWIYATQNDPIRAREVFRHVDFAPLDGTLFVSEYSYTDAWVLLAEGQPEEALSATLEGLEVVRRVSSARNGLFLRARCHEAMDEIDQALDFYGRAVNSEYTCQGGGGLLAWGDLLQRLGRHDEATYAWKLIGKRDPESEAAVIAGSRLRG